MSLGGAFVALLVTGMSFSMPSLIGLIMLMGIATRNSIHAVHSCVKYAAGAVPEARRPVLMEISLRVNRVRRLSRIDTARCAEETPKPWLNCLDTDPERNHAKHFTVPAVAMRHVSYFARVG